MLNHQKLTLFKPQEFLGPFLFLHISTPQTKSFSAQDKIQASHEIQLSTEFF